MQRSKGGVATHVALLRGINVAGKNRLPMKALVSVFEDVGCTKVRTYIQSGNVVFDVSRGNVQRIRKAVTTLVSERYGLEVPVVLRTSAELSGIVVDNPFLRQGTDPKALHVVFLADRPVPANVARLDLRRSPPDECDVRGREIYLMCPEGFGKSKFTNAYFDSVLRTTSTVRNWATVLKLVELAG